MKHAISILIILFILTAYAEKSLVLVKDLGMHKDEFPIIYVVENQYLILAENTHLELLKTKRIQYNILDTELSGKEYYFVWPFLETPDKSIIYSEKIMSKYGKILACFKKGLIMQSDPERLHSMAEYRVQLDFIAFKPMDFNTSGNTTIPPGNKISRYNLALQDMLDRVNPDSVEAFQRKLVSFHTRHIKSNCSKDEVIPYIKKMYKKYGCDSIISLSLGNGKSPEIVGVRKGKKDPSLKKFVLLGGHIDNIQGGDVNAAHEGANDNATGQVAVLEACRVHQYYDFDYTILYCTHNGEEVGFIGSKAVCGMLKSAGAKTIGGNFSYDMFGMEKSDIKFKVYDKNTGAKEFVAKMEQLKNLYKLTQPTSITTTSSIFISSDPFQYWSNGFTCIGHNFATAGAGKIHTLGDNMKDSYDKVFQAECAKLGIVTTAEYAGVNATKIQNKINAISPKSLFNYTQGPDCIVFNLVDNKYTQKGKIDVFNCKGTLIKTIPVDTSIKKITWDQKNNNGSVIASHSVLFIQYSNPTLSLVIKMVTE